MSNKLFQIILSPYETLPAKVSDAWINSQHDVEYYLYNDKQALQFLSTYQFQPEYRSQHSALEGFEQGIGKWKADLLRFCLLSRYTGLYVDLDLSPCGDLAALPDVDFISCIGAHSPTEGITPLPNGELAIGFMKTNSPEPILEEFIVNSGVIPVGKGEPYAFNIQGLYALFCHRLGVERLDPFKTYVDPKSGRSYYFIQEQRVKKKFKMINEKGEILIHSQNLDHALFFNKKKKPGLIGRLGTLFSK